MSPSFSVSSSSKVLSWFVGVVVSNLDARIELEFSLYETYKVIDLEKK